MLLDYLKFLFWMLISNGIEYSRTFINPLEYWHFTTQIFKFVGQRVTQKLYVLRIYDVKEFKLHPDYDNEWVVYDYAVIRLKRDIKFTPIVNAACLPRYFEFLGFFSFL